MPSLNHSELQLNGQMWLKFDVFDDVNQFYENLGLFSNHHVTLSIESLHISLLNLELT